jgi:hypothetical protein
MVTIEQVTNWILAYYPGSPASWQYSCSSLQAQSESTSPAFWPEPRGCRYLLAEPATMDTGEVSQGFLGYSHRQRRSDRCCPRRQTDAQLRAGRVG